MRTYHRNAVIFAGIFTLIQGGIWAFISVYSVGIYACTFDYPYYSSGDNTVGNLFFYSYLQGRCRLDPTSGPIPQMRQPQRTYTIMLIYGIASAVWIPSALLILIIAVNRIHGKTGARCYYPWIITTAFLLVLDIVATVIYTIDIANTMTPQDYRSTFPYVPVLKVRGLEGLTVVPAVLMVILFSRAIIIWLINLVIFIVTIQAVVNLKKPSPTAQFVESEARVKPDKTVSPSNWVRLNRRAPEAAERPVELPQRMRVQRTEDASLPRREARRNLDSDRDVIQSPSEERERPILKPLVLSPPAQAPPPPPSPFFDVYGKPTTPDSPQPVFVRSGTSNQLQGGVNRDVPWSYVNPQKVPSLPKPLPEPDYTLHRMRRSNTTTPSDDGDYKPPVPKRYEHNPNVWKVM